jgi:hypothetical protein
VLLFIFLSSVVLAGALAFGAAWLFSKPIDDFLERFIVDPMVCEAWGKYIRFAIVAVGISTGARVQMFEDYVSSSETTRAAILARATEEMWALELYRTVTGTIVGLAWLMLAFCVMVLIAKVAVKSVSNNAARAATEADRSQGSVFNSQQNQQ